MADIDREDGVVPGEDVTMKEPEGPRGTLPSEENLWDEVPDDSKPIFKDDQTLMKPETVILSAPKIFR
jgi:hypothetical protein|eukprot:g4332.t1